MATTKTPRKRERTQAQIDAEARREDADAYGKTLLRHTRDSKAATTKVMKRFDVSAPEALRIAIIELAKKGNR